LTSPRATAGRHRDHAAGEAHGTRAAHRAPALIAGGACWRLAFVSRHEPAADFSTSPTFNAGARRCHAHRAAGGFGKKFDARFGELGEILGRRSSATNLTVAAAGHARVSVHNHRVNEEMFFISKAAAIAPGVATHAIKAATSSPARRAGRRPRTRSSTPRQPN